MHPVMTIVHWTQHLHDIRLFLWHQIVEHLHSRHFWVGVVLTLLLAGVVTLLFILARNAPYIYPRELPYIPYVA